MEYRNFETPKEFKNWFKLNYPKKYFKMITEFYNDNQSPLAGYKGDSFKGYNKIISMPLERAINEYDSIFIERVYKLQDLLLSHTINENLCTYRFATQGEFNYFFSADLTRTLIRNDTFLSTTLLPKYYAGNKGFYINRRVIKLLINQGTKGLILPEVTSVKAEYELVMPARYKLKFLYFERGMNYYPSKYAYQMKNPDFLNVPVFEVLS